MSIVTRRDYNNSHNGINGSVRCIITYMRRVDQAPSLTPTGRIITTQINKLLAILDEETWTFRQELDGNITMMKHKNERKFFL